MQKITYTITSPRFTGAVTIIFDDNNHCHYFNAQEATLTPTQLKWFLEKLTMPLQAFLKQIESKQVFTIVGQMQELTFDMFWNTYNEKKLSSKKKAQAKWNKLNKQQQILAYLHIPKYFKSIPNGIAKKYAETYLNSELWNN